ncbi:MAG: type II toxin-antitoxin system YafQ family toxin [Clostridium sp.]|jgi:mRNA interferase YafQ|nr:type II toxin-antitoxin system YafQ family toxin [Clostridium sp.]
MRYEVRQSARFKRDLKTAMKRGYDIDRLEAVVDLLANGMTLPLKNRDHDLTGDRRGYRECHITPDWLLIYQHRESEVVLCLFRTGTHSDPF